MVDSRISPGNRTQSRPYAVPGRQQSCSRHGKWMGHHRGLRAGQGFRRVNRELGRASRLLGSNSRNEGDRHKQHPGVGWPTRPIDELNPKQTGKNTNQSASPQGTGREHKAHRPGQTKAVVATHSTARRGATSARRRGEPRPKGPTIRAARQREGKAGHDVYAEERQLGHRAHQAVSTKAAWIAQKSSRPILRLDGQQQSCHLVVWLTARLLAQQGPLLTNRMTELVTYGSVGGGGSNPAPYPAPNRRPRFPLGALAELAYSVSAPPASPAAVGEARCYRDMKLHSILFGWSDPDQALRVAAGILGKRASDGLRPSGHYCQRCEAFLTKYRTWEPQSGVGLELEDMVKTN